MSEDLETPAVKPERIVLAVRVLYGGFGVSLLAIVINELLTLHDIRVSDVAVFALYFYFYRAMIGLIDQGNNTARWIALAMFALHFVLALAIDPEFLNLGPPTWFDALTGGLWIVLNTIACYLLFTQPGAAWFETVED